MRTIPAMPVLLLLALPAASLHSQAPRAADSVTTTCAACAAWNAPQAPFQVYGNTYYVGTRGLGALLITSAEGHVLVDGGLPESGPLIVRHIRELGFRIEDVKVILNSHAHFDHAGGIALLQRLSGATVMASSWSAEVLRRGRVGPDDPQYGAITGSPPVANIKVFADGQTLHVGPIAITPHFTPGHTPGGTSWSWESCGSLGCRRLVYGDSQSAVSAPDFKFTRSTTYPGVLADFARSFEVLERLPCEILLTPHPEASGVWERLARREAGAADALIDSTACRRYAETARARLARRVAQEAQYQGVQPTRTELMPVAAVLAQASAQISDVWPGFWSSSQSFLLLSPSGGMLLVASFAAPSEFTPVPGDTVAPWVAGRAYTRDGALPGTQSGTFPGTYDLGGHSVYALPPMGSTLFRRVSFYVHEAFHFYQRTGSNAWVSTPGDSIMGLSPVAFLRDSAIVRDETFRAALRHEDELLRRVVTAQDRSILRDVLRRYLAVRIERLRGRPDVLAIEQRYERREGTAVYVGCRAAALGLQDSDALSACVTRDLGEENPANPALQFLRWRPYSVGAILSLALDRLAVPSWKAGVASGEQLDQLVTLAVAP